MKLSIIIPVYNVEKYVEKCIRSCENQDIPKEDYEVIVVNDGSPDGSLAIVERVAKEYPNIKVISQENGGLSAARNTGMRNAIGEYYMFVDSDDSIAENCLGRLIEKLNLEKPDALAFCPAYLINEEPKRRWSYLDESTIKGRDFLKMKAYPCACFAIWKASFFKSNGLVFYKGIFHEDSELIPRAYYLADKVSRTNDLVYYVYQNPQSICRSVNPKKSFDIVEVVCPHISDFVKTVDDDYKVVFYNILGQDMSDAMHYIKGAKKEDRDKLNKAIVERGYLWNDIRKSSILKYKIEAYLVCVFKNHPLRVFEILQKFNIKNWK